MYTSGTTGNPKGVMLTHGNLLSNAISFIAAAPPPPDCVFLSWLPYSHIYARTVDIYGTLVAGSTLCLAESADTLVLNLAETRPHMMSSVPRFYEKILGAVQADPKTAKMKLRDLRPAHRLAQLRRRPTAPRGRPGVPGRGPPVAAGLRPDGDVAGDLVQS